MGGIVVCVVFAGVFLLVSMYQNRFFQAAYQAEHFVSNTAKYLTGRADEAAADGHINRGNEYRTGTVQLEVETYVLPTEPLYLRGFSGNEYVGGEWRGMDDRQLFEQTARLMGSRQSVNTVNVMYGGMYYTLNSFLSGDGIRNSRNVNIRHVSGKYRNYFEPYGGQWISGTTYSIYYSYAGYDYRYYEQGDMKIDWNRVSKAFSNQAEWYGNLQDAYMEAVGNTCLEVPRGRLPRLTELCESYPLEDFDEITMWITATLGNRAVYTQMPGNAPVNKDIVEYFLFESGKGYCQHFASAATLMYRLYGIPARYASGYRVSPSDFQLEKGVYRAHVTDESAHAWVEVFIRDFGWVPIEVTPASDGTIQPSYPGIDLTEWEQTLEKLQWELDLDMRFQDSDSKSKLEPKELQEDADWTWVYGDIPWEEYKTLLCVASAIVLYTILLIPFFLDFRRLKYQERFHGKGCQEHFRRLVRMLHRAGYLADYDGTEADFAEKLAEQFPEICRADVVLMAEIAERATYGRPGAVSKMEDAFVKEQCGEFSGKICDRLQWYQKWIFRVRLHGHFYSSLMK